ncbi:MAG: hypothetical protein GXO07_04095 [Crenarchaeota archaeon]|nr:hypothetical protein [Thermoproteota archaeon]
MRSSEDEKTREALNAALSLIDSFKDYGYVRIASSPAFEDLVAASQLQQTLENNDIKAIMDIFPLKEPDDDSPLVSIGLKTGRRKGPTLEIVPGPALATENKVSFWIRGANSSSIIIKLLEERFVVRDEYKVFTIIASYVAEENPLEGLTSLVVESLKLSNIVKEDITFSLYKWKSLPVCYSVAYTAVPYFVGLTAFPEKVCNFFKENKLEIDESTTIKDLMQRSDSDTLVEMIKSLITYLTEVTRRADRDPSEILDRGVELNEDVLKERRLPKILVHGFKQASFVFLSVSDLSLYHVAALPALSYYFYRAEELYLKNVRYASRELPNALLAPKVMSHGGRKVSVLSLDERPPAPTLLYRMVRDFGMAREPGHLVVFKVGKINYLPFDALRRSGADMERTVKRALEEGWKVEGGSLVVEDEKGERIRKLLLS